MESDVVDMAKEAAGAMPLIYVARGAEETAEELTRCSGLIRQAGWAAYVPETCHPLIEYSQVEVVALAVLARCDGVLLAAGWRRVHGKEDAFLEHCAELGIPAAARVSDLRLALRAAAPE